MDWCGMSVVRVMGGVSGGWVSSSATHVHGEHWLAGGGSSG